jgi:hypothetical protein
MIKDKHVIKALPLLASALGRKYGVKVEIGGDSAYTDGRTIHLPSLPAEGDPGLLALARGFIDHESAHIRETDFALLQRQSLTPLGKHLWNLVEDYRVEEKLAAIFPGCGDNLNRLLRYLLQENQFQIETTDGQQPVLNWLLCKIRGWRVNEFERYAKTSARETETRFPGLLEKLSPMVDDIPVRCQSAQDSLDIARDLLRVLEEYSADIQEQLEEQKRKRGSTPAGNGDRAQAKTGDGNTGNLDSRQAPDEKSIPEPADNTTRKPASDQASDPDNDNSRQAPDSPPTQEQSCNDINDIHGENPGGNTSPQRVSDSEAAPEGEAPDRDMAPEQVTNDEDIQNQMPGGQARQARLTDEQLNRSRQNLQAMLNADKAGLPQDMEQIMSKALGQLSAMNNELLVSVAVVNPAPTWDLNEIQINAVRKATTALRIRLQGLLQSQVFKPGQHGYRGRLDTRGLHRLAVNNPKVFKKKEYRQGLDTAVHILLDSSGSMLRDNAINLASQACYATAQALALIPGVVLAVTAFPGTTITTPERINRHTVTPILTAGQKMHGKFGFNPGGGTPMDSALWWVMAQTRALPQKRKIILIITDGQPDHEDSARQAIASAIKQGLELYGIGINNQHIQNLLPQSSQVINKIDDLPASMFGLLQKTLLQA